MFRKSRGAALIAAVVVFTLIGGTVFAAPSVTQIIYGEISGEKLPTQIQETLQQAGVKDVKPSDWFAGSIAVLIEAGLMKADANGYVNAGKSASGQETAAMFARVLGLAKKTDADDKALASMIGAGLVQKDADFSKDMTRLDVARLLGKALKVSTKAVTDPNKYPFWDFNKVSAEDRGILAALYELGIFKGYPDKTFGPGDVMTKAMIAILVDRILGGTSKK